MGEEYDMQFREFNVRGLVYSGNENHARHSVYWALVNSEQSDQFLINEIEITERETKNG